MAIYTTQKSQTYGTVVGQGMSRALVTDIVSVALTTAMIDNVNDEVELLWVPKGAVIVGAMLSATDMDTNVSPTLAFDVGDDSDEDRIFAASTVGQAGTLSAAIARTAHGYKYTAATKIKAYVQAVSATGAAGTLTFTIQYFVDENFSATNAVVS
jgi:hypothetical protein